MAKKSNLQIWAEYLPLRILVGALAIVPRSSAVWIGITLARLVYLMTGGRKTVALKNLEIAFPDLSVEDRLNLLKRSFASLGRLLGEMSQFAKTTPEKLRSLVEYEFETSESLKSAERKYFDAERAKGRGMILVSPHLGNWEMGVFAYSALNEPLEYLARPLDNPKIESFVASLRSRFGNRPINKNNSVGAAMQILGAGGILGALPDVNVHPKDGVFVPFFGKLACTTRGLAMLAIRTNAIIVPTCCVWDEIRAKYIGKYGTLIEPVANADRTDEITRLTAAITLEMEKFIRDAPDQWIWTHKRWKTRPPGESPIY